MNDENNDPQVNGDSQEISEDNINLNNLTNLTDSDIEDEKYQPNYIIPQNRTLYRNHSSNNIRVQNNVNIEIQNKKIQELNNKILELTKSNQEYEIQLKNYKIEFQKLQEAY